MDIVRVGVSEFFRLLTCMIDPGGLGDLWPSKFIVKFEILDRDIVPEDNI